MSITKLGSIKVSQKYLWIYLWNPALTLLIQSNYNIDFIDFNIKALTFVCYITNYAIKDNYSQYSYVIGAAFVQSISYQAIYKDNNQCHVNLQKTITIDKFALCTFNCLVYNCEISGLLVASRLLDLPKY